MKIAHNSNALSGYRILVTRAKSQAGPLSKLLLKKGAKVIEIPTIEIKPIQLSRKGKGTDPEDYTVRLVGIFQYQCG